MPFSRHFELQLIISTSLFRSWGRWETHPERGSHDQIATSVLTRACRKPKPIFATRPGRVSPARFPPRKGVSQYGLEVSRAGRALTMPSTELLHDELRALPRAPAASSHAVEGVYRNRHATQAAIVAVLPDRRQTRLPCTSIWQPNGLRSRCPRVAEIMCM